MVALIRRDYAITRAYPLAITFDVVFGLIDVLIFFFISRTFGDAASADLQGAPTYFAFVVVGIVTTLVVSAASADVGVRLQQEQVTGTLEALVTQPIGSTQIAFGLVGFPFGFALARGLVYLLVASAALGLDLSRASWAGCILVLTASGLALLSVGIVLGAVVLVLKRGQSLVGVAITGLAFVSGAFFPAQILPNWLELLGRLVPTRYVYDGVRAALYEGRGWGDDALVLLAFSVVALPVALWVFSRALAFTKRAGSLGQY